MTSRPGRLLAAVVSAGLLLSACGAGAATVAPTSNVTAVPATPAAVTPAPTPVSVTAAPATAAPATAVAASPTAVPPAPTAVPATPTAVAPNPNDLLAIIKARGKIVMSTDPEYPPQSFLDPADQMYKGFDIDVGTEIAKRLGVTIDYFTPSWEILTAGSWGGHWDFSVGSMTITSKRQKVLDFTEPYYFTPAEMSVRTDTGITTLAGLAGKTVCVGAGTTYLDWLNGTLDFGTESPQTQPPAGVVATTLSTDRKCPEAWKRGRKEFDGWLSSSTTVDQAIKDGLPVTKIGDPVFYEPLAVAIDKSGTPHVELLAALEKIVEGMHADGTLSALSMKWFAADLTVQTGN